MQRFAITGSSGYLGAKLVDLIRKTVPDAQILGIDLRPSKDHSTDQFEQSDVRDPKVRDALRAFRPDTVIHSAFAVTPIRDKKLMRSINLDGFENIRNAVAELSPERFHVVSSATAFGAWPDNPIPIPEDYPTRGRPEFIYSADKSEIERILVEFSANNPGIVTSWVRPAIIVGPKMDNYLTQILFKGRVLARLDGEESKIQFVHEDDLTRAIMAILKQSGRGAYNVGPADWVTGTELAKATRTPYLTLPFGLARVLTDFFWNLRCPLIRVPGGFWYFARYPWVVDSARLRNELKFEFQYTSRQTMDEYVVFNPRSKR